MTGLATYIFDADGNPYILGSNTDEHIYDLYMYISSFDAWYMVKIDGDTVHTHWVPILNEEIPNAVKTALLLIK